MTEYFADISSYQRSDLGFFQDFINSGVSSVFIKTTQGSATGTNYVNPKSKEQAKNALSAGMNVGFYHYFLATSIADAINEAQFFEQSVVNLGFVKDTPLCVDVEDSSLNKNQVAGYVDTFINYLAENGYTNIIQYSMGSWFWNGYLNASKHPTWVANYGVNAVGVSGDVIGWQYTSTWGGGSQDMSYDCGIFNKKAETKPQDTPVKPVKSKVEDVIKLNEDTHGVDNLGVGRPTLYKKNSVWKSSSIVMIKGQPHYKIATNIYVPISKTTFNDVVIVKYIDDKLTPIFDKKGNRVSNDDVISGKAFKYSSIDTINGISMAKIATNEYLPMQYTSGSDFK
ncbi:hypothetical protein M5C72_07015 [Companilactobacillus allii]|uniref:Lysozyme n=1 Tax=Companilactobacillus allii TaxID=1847728 RepID=A0A1P8Q4R9_9LACO|nr:GH25 family lysozyme [Companilactobacillus allii]APX72847.1 hypothetical protein BTM29_09925 [Companilactobacillus allii]USQ67635.1 hypothetical protein M5C72_07015 [Companilactobacillus allii]